MEAVDAFSTSNAPDVETSVAQEYAESYQNNGSCVSTRTLQDFRHKKFCMAALDLDGTLLDSSHRLSPSAVQHIRELDAKGFGIMVATGRALNTVYQTILDLNLPRPIPVVCSNGARGVLCKPSDTRSGVVESTELFEFPVPEPVARRCITLAKEMGFFSQYYVGDEIYADAVTQVHHELVELYKQLTGAKTKIVKCMIRDVLEKNPLPSKQLVLFPNHEQDRAMIAFEQELSQMSEDPDLFANDTFMEEPATLVRGNLGWFLEVLHPLVHKGSGLKRMCQEHLNVPLDQVLAFGDGDNDAEFLRLAGLGIAMKNARPIIKEQAADVILEWTNDDDGVIRTLQTMEQNGQLMFPTMD